MLKSGCLAGCCKTQELGWLACGDDYSDISVRVMTPDGANSKSHRNFPSGEAVHRADDL